MIARSVAGAVRGGFTTHVPVRGDRVLLGDILQAHRQPEPAYPSTSKLSAR
jgi:hypothetical protein